MGDNRWYKVRLRRTNRAVLASLLHESGLTVRETGRLLPNFTTGKRGVMSAVANNAVENGDFARRYCDKAIEKLKSGLDELGYAGDESILELIRGAKDV